MSWLYPLYRINSIIVQEVRGDSVIQFTSPSADRARPDDLSDDSHRRLIGWIGLLLPGLLVVITLERDGLERWRSLKSISHYYYTGAVAAFLGMLVALALFLLTYRGFQNANNKFDRGAAMVAGLAALAVAFFPTAAPADVPALQWWSPMTGSLHFGFATVLFLAFAFFALYLFRLNPKGQTELRGWRNRVYAACGAFILACIVWAYADEVAGKAIFIPESGALFAFSVSWLVKGYAEKMVVVTARQLFGRRSSEKSTHARRRP